MPSDDHSTLPAASSTDADIQSEKVLLHAAYPLWRKPTLIALARAKELQDQGNDVSVTYCNAKAGTCAVNYSGSPLTCLICRNRVKTSAAAAGLKAIPLDANPSNPGDEGSPNFGEKKELAEGVRSGITSVFRTLPGDSSSSSLISSIKKRYFRTASALLTSMHAVVADEQPDRVEVFNGRHGCARLALIAAKRAGIPFNTLEFSAHKKPIVFVGHTAHDRKMMQRRIMTHDADFNVAKAYYDRRRQPRGNKFAKKHAADFTPPNSDGFRRRVSVFLSSQDEFESLGKDWRSPFLNYAPIIEQACRENPDDLFCIRFHPNQADIASDITTPFQAIEQLPNVQVYYPTDTANTYTLIEWSDLVITFGSTVTVEACWMGKAAIMLGPSFYDELDVSYNPKDIDSFYELLQHDLQPKNRENAARVAGFQEFDWDPLRYVKCANGKIVEDGIRVYRPLLSQLARSSDDMVCNLIKMSTKWAMKNQRPAA